MVCFLLHPHRGCQFNIGRRVTNHELDGFGFDVEVGELFVPEGEGRGLERDGHGFGFAGLEGNALEAFELLIGARDF